MNYNFNKYRYMLRCKQSVTSTRLVLLVSAHMRKFESSGTITKAVRDVDRFAAQNCVLPPFGLMIYYIAWGVLTEVTMATFFNSHYVNIY